VGFVCLSIVVMFCMVSKLPAETAPNAQTAENAPTTETVENAPTAETQTTQPPRNEVESQAAPLPTPKEPSQQFRMKLQIRRRP